MGLKSYHCIKQVFIDAYILSKKFGMRKKGSVDGDPAFYLFIKKWVINAILPY
jgi:hypothetical protein